MGQIPFARQRLDQFSVSGLLEFNRFVIARGQDRCLGIEFIWTHDGFGTRHRDTMAPAGAAFGEHQIVLPIVLVQVGAFSNHLFGKNVSDGTYEFTRIRIIFLKHNAGKPRMVFAEIPEHIDQPLAPIVIMKKRRVKATGVEIDRLRPWPENVRRSDEVVVHVFEVADSRPDDGVDEPELAAAIAQRRRPDASGIADASQIQLGTARQGVADQSPVDEVLGVVNRHTGKPFKGAVGDVVIVVDSEK